MRAREASNEAVRRYLDLVARLTRRLDAVPIDVLSEEYAWEDFGSWSLVVGRGTKRFRIDFDGKERVLRAYSVAKGGGHAARAPELVAEQPLPHGLTQESSELVYAFMTQVTTPASQ